MINFIQQLLQCLGAQAASYDNVVTITVGFAYVIFTATAVGILVGLNYAKDCEEAHGKTCYHH